MPVCEPEHGEELKEGQYLYYVSRTLLGNELIIRRDVLLVWDLKNDMFEIGHSKRPESRYTSGRISTYSGRMYASPAEAVNAYVTENTADHEKHILLDQADIASRKASIKALRKMDHTKLKVEKRPDDWTPCDF